MPRHIICLADCRPKLQTFAETPMLQRPLTFYHSNVWRSGEVKAVETVLVKVKACPKGFERFRDGGCRSSGQCTCVLSLRWSKGVRAFYKWHFNPQSPMLRKTPTSVSPFNPLKTSSGTLTPILRPQILHPLEMSRRVPDARASAPKTAAWKPRIVGAGATTLGGGGGPNGSDFLGVLEFQDLGL